MFYVQWYVFLDSPSLMFRRNKEKEEWESKKDEKES